MEESGTDVLSLRNYQVVYYAQNQVNEIQQKAEIVHECHKCVMSFSEKCFVVYE